jgi:hypothetical protein
MKALDICLGLSFSSIERQGILNPLALYRNTLSHSKLQHFQKEHVHLVMHFSQYRGCFIYLDGNPVRPYCHV